MILQDCYEKSIYDKRYLEKIKEEIKFHYHAYKVRVSFRLNNKVVKCTVSPLYFGNKFPTTFTVKGDNFEGLWNFLENNPGQYTFIGASRRKPDKFHKNRRLVFDFTDFPTKPWVEGQTHKWEFTRELFIEYPSMKDITESSQSIESIVPYIMERIGL